MRFKNHGVLCRKKTPELWERNEARSALKILLVNKSTTHSQRASQIAPNRANTTDRNGRDRSLTPPPNA